MKLSKKDYLAGALALCAGLPNFALAQDRESSQSAQVADEGTIDDQWMLATTTPLATPVYPPSMAAHGASACVALGYRIGKDGHTSDFSVLKVWNNESGEAEPVEGFWQAFGQAGADAVAQWHFKARPDVSPTPTDTVATLGFFPEASGLDPAEIRGHCKISDLKQYLADMDIDGFDPGDLGQFQMDMQRRAQTQVARDAALRSGARNVDGASSKNR